MAGEVVVNVANGNEDVTMEFGDLGELAKLLKLAGIASPANDEHVATTNDDGSIDVDVDNGMISLPTETDENADYDYGINPTSRKGYVYDVDPYKYQGDAELKTRPVPYRSGDNPLVWESRTFMKYLREVEEKDGEWAPHEDRVKTLAARLSKTCGIPIAHARKHIKKTAGYGGLSDKAWLDNAKKSAGK